MHSDSYKKWYKFLVKPPSTINRFNAFNVKIDFLIGKFRNIAIIVHISEITEDDVCVCVCVFACLHVYVVYEDTNLYNDMGMT